MKTGAGFDIPKEGGPCCPGYVIELVCVDHYTEFLRQLLQREDHVCLRQLVRREDLVSTQLVNPDAHPPHLRFNPRRNGAFSFRCHCGECFVFWSMGCYR